MDAIAIQRPIFNKDEEVQAYELLAYPSLKEFFTTDAGKRELAHITAALSGDDEESSTEIFLNIPPDLLLEVATTVFQGEMDHILSGSRTIIVLTAPPDLTEEVITTCKQLKDRNYQLAMGAFVLKEKYQALAEWSDIITMDLPEVTAYGREINFLKMRARGVKLMGCNLDSRASFNQAKDRGFTYYQGHFYVDPVIIPEISIPPAKLNYLHFLQEINQPEIDFVDLDEVLKKDETLSTQLLNYFNSDEFNQAEKLTSLREAFNYFGIRKIRKWASLLTIMNVGKDLHPEVQTRCLARGKMLEDLSGNIGKEDLDNELFLMGIFSMMDLFAGRPRAEIIQDIPLNEEVKKVLLNEESPLQQLLETVVAYEEGNWKEIQKNLSGLNLDVHALHGIYWNAMDWSRRFLKFISAD